MVEDLKYTFANVTDWLKFAEAKNAGLIALNAATIIGIMQINTTFLTITYPFFRGLLVIMFCLSAILCIFSILPQTDIKFRTHKKMKDAEFINKRGSLNCLFYGHIALLSSEQFLELYLSKISSSTITPNITSAHKDLIYQIVINADIALQKFQIFRLSAWLSFCGGLITIILILIAAFS